MTMSPFSNTAFSHYTTNNFQKIDRLSHESDNSCQTKKIPFLTRENKIIIPTNNVNFSVSFTETSNSQPEEFCSLNEKDRGSVLNSMIPAVVTPSSAISTHVPQDISTSTVPSAFQINTQNLDCSKQSSTDKTLLVPIARSKNTNFSFFSNNNHQEANVPMCESDQKQQVPVCFDKKETNPSSNQYLDSKEGNLKHEYFAPIRLNKFVRRLHDMLQSEKTSEIVEWRRGLLVLHSTVTFAKQILPKYFNTNNFKTFRRQLNYYGFVHVRSFSATGSTTTALWVNKDLARYGSDSISSVLMLRRVEPRESEKTAEGRRVRKEEAFNSVDDFQISPHIFPMKNNNYQVKTPGIEGQNLKLHEHQTSSLNCSPPIPMVVHCHYDSESQASTPSLDSISSPNGPIFANSFSLLPPQAQSSHKVIEGRSHGKPLSKHKQLDKNMHIFPSTKIPPSDDSAAELLIMLSKSRETLV